MWTQQRSAVLPAELVEDPAKPAPVGHRGRDAMNRRPWRSATSRPRSPASTSTGCVRATRRSSIVHGVPTGSFDWIPFLERIGGVAPDLPGFGRSAKPGDFEYSIAGYDRFLEAFTAQTGLERFSLVVHDFGGVGLVFAQRFPERIEKLVLFTMPAAAARLPLAPRRARLAHARHRRADDGLHDSLGAAARAAARARRPRLGALRPGDTARDPEALPLRAAEAVRALRRRDSASSAVLH